MATVCFILFKNKNKTTKKTVKLSSKVVELFFAFPAAMYESYFYSRFSSGFGVISALGFRHCSIVTLLI